MRKQFESIWSWLTCVMFRAADVGTLTRSDHTNHRCQSTNGSNIALAFKWLLVNGIVNPVRSDALPDGDIFEPVISSRPRPIQTSFITR